MVRWETGLNRRRVLSAFAGVKVNLCLHVRGRRADGLHELQSFVRFADFGDHLTLYPGEPLGLTVEGPFADSLLVRENIILSAAQLYAARVIGGPARGHFHLVKRVPVASGIGAGSADAALALRLLELAYNGRGGADVKYVALCLGADVPVCLLGRPCWVQGIGDHLTPTRGTNPSLYALLFNPLIPLFTRRVFAALNAPLICSDDDRVVFPDSWKDREDFLTFLKTTRNDLEEPAHRFVPIIGNCLDAISRTQGCLLARMSGSGATVFGLYGSWEESCAAAASLRSLYPDWWICPVTLRGA